MLSEHAATPSWPPLLRQARRMQGDINRLFGALPYAAQAEFPPVNVWAGLEGAVVTTEIPGINPDALDITVYQDTVTLRGTRDPEIAGDDVIVHRQERPHGPFTRTVVLPFRVDADKVSARFARGILTLELPRPEADKPRQIKIPHG
jgi:HSP20 family protein